MKKFICCTLAAAAIIAGLPFSGCKKSDSPSQLSSYDITAEYDGDGELVGVVEFEFYNSTGNEIDSLSFNLWGNAYRRGAEYSPVGEGETSAYWSGKSYGDESVTDVAGCSSWEICGEDENILKVILTSPVYPDESAKVTISYTLHTAKINHRTGITATTVNLGNFYPVLCAYTTEGFCEAPYYNVGDPFLSECADYRVRLTLPKDYIAATSGSETAREKTDDGMTYTYELSCARDFAAVLSKNFKTLTAECGDTTITAYYCGTEPTEAFAAVCESFEYFSSTFGKYPYPALSVAFTPLTMSGMEYPALTMINSTLTETDTVYTAVHENAHQWWYAAVGSDQINYAWQDEGLAEYSALCFFENNTSYGYTRTGILSSAIKAYRGYYSVYSQIFGKTDTTMSRSLKDFAGNYEYANIAYNKGLLLFESVRGALGDKKFFAALQEYYSANVSKIASAEELISHFTSRGDTEGIFDSYINGKIII